MKINLAQSAGFCSGVKRAIDIALATAGKGKKVCMLGDIVHNEDVVKEIKKAGIKKISSLANGNNTTLLIRAHGSSIKIMKQAKNLGYSIIDATCPMVKEIHRIVREMETAGYTIIVIGDTKHDEVHGIIGQLKKPAVVIQDIDHIPWKRIHPIQKACVVSQSTQNIKKVTAIVSCLKKHIPRVSFYNTICRPTRIKQAEMESMPLENDLMIIIGSKTSANTKRLYELSRELNAKSYWVSSKKDINLKWLQGGCRVGITAGASTPQHDPRDSRLSHKTKITIPLFIYLSLSGLPLYANWQSPPAALLPAGYLRRQNKGF